MSKKGKYVVVIAGPTAVGKTALSIQIAEKYNLEVINADSRQVYADLQIGTAAPSKAEMRGIKHHFVNEISFDTPFSAGIFERRALEVADGIFRHDHALVLTGGSGLYINAFLHGIDPIPEVPLEVRKELIFEFEQGGLGPLLTELKKKDIDYYNKVDRANPQRIVRSLEIIRHTGKPFSTFRQGKRKFRPFDSIKIALDLPRETLYRRIDTRVNRMIEQGLFDEVSGLQQWREHNALQTVGYKEVFGYFDGLYSQDECISLIKRNSRRYAKRQLTWLRKDPAYRWFNPDDLQGIMRIINGRLNTKDFDQLQ